MLSSHLMSVTFVRCGCSCQLRPSWNSLTAKDIMQPTYFIPETMSTWNALQALQRRRMQLAIVVDEYGGTSGLVTFEDILEEVVGEIYDEDDSEEQQEDQAEIARETDGSYAIKGSANLDDVCEALGIELDDEQLQENSMTIGGLLCARVGEIPRAGQFVDIVGYRFTATEVDERRVIGVRAESLSSIVDTAATSATVGTVGLPASTSSSRNEKGTAVVMTEDTVLEAVRQDSVRRDYEDTGALSRARLSVAEAS